MTKQRINQEEMLKDLLSTACDNICFQNDGINHELNNLYGTLIDILEEKCDDEQKEILHAIDDVVSFLLCGYYDDGVVSGMEPVSAVNEVMSNPSNAYKNTLSSKSVSDSPYSTAYKIANKYIRA